MKKMTLMEHAEKNRTTNDRVDLGNTQINTFDIREREKIKKLTAGKKKKRKRK